MLGTLTAVAVAGAVIWRQYITFSQVDYFLVGCWALMALLMSYGVAPAHDLRLALVAFAGGAFIEWWGTQSGLWAYFTSEKPPLFILPAWPAAALATHRIARAILVLSRRLPLRKRGWRVAWLASLAVVLIVLGPWLRPAAGNPITWVAALFFTGSLITRGDHREHLCRLMAGALLGYLLERWGTTRQCWTYWSGGTPPLASVLAHGVATLGFARGALVGALLGKRTVAAGNEAF
jgi:uncharacterized membrane protein YoaT (DUF817 family)